MHCCEMLERDHEARLLVDEGLRGAVRRVAAAGAVRRRDVGLEAAVLGRRVGVGRLLRLVAKVLRTQVQQVAAGPGHGFHDAVAKQWLQLSATGGQSSTTADAAAAVGAIPEVTGLEMAAQLRQAST